MTSASPFRPDDALLTGYREVARCYSASAVFADVQGRRNVMDSGIKPIFDGKLVGRALTVKLSAGDLQDPLAVLDVVKPGEVVVVDAAGETETAVWGGLMAQLGQQQGIAGVVVDGSVRDIDEMRDLKFLLFSRAVTPRGTHTMFSKRRDEVQLNVPVQCGGVMVSPGDMIVGDVLGVTVVPAASALEVLRLAKEQADREDKTRRAIAGGKTYEQLLQEFGRI
jgi:4-hydroxy-4-methyl-2-oxoglutarate aldolase